MTMVVSAKNRKDVRMCMGEIINTLEVGDKVYVLSGEGVHDYTCGWVDSMNDFVGKICTISSVYENGHGCSLEESFLTFDDRYLQKVDAEFEFDEMEFDKKIDLFFR